MKTILDTNNVIRPGNSFLSNFIVYHSNYPLPLSYCPLSYQLHPLHQASLRNHTMNDDILIEITSIV